MINEGNFTLRVSISPSNYINSPMLHHQNRSVLANSYQANRHVPSHLILSVTIRRAWWHEKSLNWSECPKWELNKQANGSLSIIKWSDEEIFPRWLMLSMPCQKSGWVFINQAKPLTFSWLPLLTGGGNVDSWCINAERSWMRPTKTAASFRTVLAVLKGATHTQTSCFYWYLGTGDIKCKINKW